MNISPIFRVVIILVLFLAIGGAIVYFLNREDTSLNEPPSVQVGKLQQKELQQQTVIGITVEGAGEAKALADTVILSLAVQTSSDSALEATTSLATQSNTLIQALATSGIVAPDVQTGSLSINPVYNNSDLRASDKPPAIVGYKAANSILVTVRDIKLASQVLDTALQAGANTVQSIQFTSSKTKSLKRQALEAATRDAAHKAETVASSLGGKISGLISITEVTSPTPLSFQRMSAELAGGSAQIPIEAGNISVTALVSANFGFE
tara:strand:+ start:633 stop:1427 length:795 start_codon:yes stop_codon:yes gene_type:complete